MTVSNRPADELKSMIQSLYRFADVTPVWDGEVNERVAEIFGLMIFETRKCSAAFKWVPQPPGGRASIVWIIQNLGRGIFDHYRDTLSVTCARVVILKWGHHLAMASEGLVWQKDIPSCA